MNDNRISPASRFQSDGFFIVPDPVIPADLVERCVRGMDEVMAGRFDTGRAPLRRWRTSTDKALTKIDQAHLANSALLELVSHPALGEWAAKVTGAEVIQVWATQLFHKPPGGSHLGNVGWHQDHQYWRFWEGDVLTAWVAFSDVSEEAGALRFIRGSHLWEHAFAEGNALNQDLEGQLARITAPPGLDKEQVPAVLRRGGVSFHHSRILHASGPNFSDSPRRSMAIHLRTENARLVPGQEHYEFCAHLTDPRLSPIIFTASRP